MTEDAVGRRDNKMEVRQREVIEIVRSRHVTFLWADRENNLAVCGFVDLRRVERVQEGDRFVNARPEVGDRLLAVLKDWRVDAGEPRAGIFGRVTGSLNLPRECEHSRKQADTKQGRRVDSLRFGKGLSLVEKRHEHVEANLEYWD